MKKKILLVCMALLSLVGAQAQVPINSTTNGSDVWYFIKGQAQSSPTGLYATAKADNSAVKNLDLTLEDDQLWKVVTNGTGLALQNKFGTYLNADLGIYNNINTVAILPTNALTIELFETHVKNAVRIYGANWGLHSNQDKPNASWFSYWDSNDHSSFVFIPQTAHKELLLEQITIATTAVETTPSQYPEQAKTDLNAAIQIATAIQTDATKTYDDSKVAIVALQAAVKTFLATKIWAPEAVASTADNPVWYVFQVQATDGRTGKIISYRQATGKPMSVTPPTLSNDSVLWRIECDVPNKKYAIINKANGASISGALVNGSAVCIATASYDWNVSLVAGKTGVYNFASATVESLNMKNAGDGGDFTSWSASDPASQFKAIKGSEFYITTAVSTESISPINVTVQDKMLVVTGTDAPVKAYTVSGAQVNATKALKQGVYIVKVAGLTTKVVIK